MATFRRGLSWPSKRGLNEKLLEPPAIPPSPNEALSGSPFPDLVELAEGPGKRIFFLKNFVESCSVPKGSNGILKRGTCKFKRMESKGTLMEVFFNEMNF